MVPAALVGRLSARLAGEELHAPSLMWSEASAALRQLEWRGEASKVVVADAVAWLAGVDVRPTLSRELVVEAHQLAHELGWAKSYDAEYVVLAQRLGAPLATLDVKLGRSVAALVEVLDPS